jgi:hypothetical protein
MIPDHEQTLEILYLQVVVRWPGGENSVIINVDTPTVSKMLNRAPDEPLHRALARLQTSLSGKFIQIL